jgi:hypothetical protein
MHEKRAPLWLKGAAIAVLAAHLALVIAVIIVYANRTPTSDEWHSTTSSGVAARAVRGQLTLSDLLVSYNGHRFPITLSITALNAVLLSYDPRLEMLVTAALIFTNFCLVAALMRQVVGKTHLFWLGLLPLAADDLHRALVGALGIWHDEYVAVHHHLHIARYADRNAPSAKLGCFFDEPWAVHSGSFFARRRHIGVCCGRLVVVVARRASSCALEHIWRHRRALRSSDLLR